MRRRSPLEFALVAAVLGCGAVVGDPEAEGDAGISATGISSTGITSAGVTTAPILDVGDGDGSRGGGGDGGNLDGCEKVDFLFVIDSSNSMQTNQAELVASFPEFVAGIQSTLEDVDSYHVGIVTSDPYEFNGDGCTEIGALVTRTGGKDSSDKTCSPYAGGGRFMTEADDLPTTFACAALVGTDGENDEAMLEGATQAISPELNAPDACNDGFIRDDALLVLVLITDEDDPGTCVNGGSSCNGSPGNPQSWYDDVLTVKSFPENVVALSLVRGAPNNECGQAQGTEKDGDRVMDFVTKFGSTGLRGDICADSFGPFFDQAIALIESACGGFIDPAG